MELNENMKRLFELNEEITTLINNQKAENTNKEEEYTRTLVEKYNHFKETILPYINLFWKVGDNDWHWKYQHIKFNEEGWIIGLSKFGCYVGYDEHYINFDFRVSGCCTEQLGTIMRNAEYVVKEYKNNDNFVKVMNNWDDYFPIFEKNFISTFHAVNTERLKRLNAANEEIAKKLKSVL